MKIPNYDFKGGNIGEKFKQIYPYMPNNTFRMLICGPSGSGKTNTLIHMLIKPLLYFDKMYLYAKNLEQDTYQELLNKFQPINKEIGYNIIETSNNEIIPVSELKDDNQKIVIFDDFVTEKNQKPLIDYFIQGSAPRPFWSPWRVKKTFGDYIFQTGRQIGDQGWLDIEQLFLV